MEWKRLWIGAYLSAIILVGIVPPAQADDPDNCLFCHQYRGLCRYDTETDKLFPFFVKPEYVYERLGPHARVACTDCHDRSEVDVVPHKPTSRVDCTKTCHITDASGMKRKFSHENVAEMLQRSVHTPEVLSKIDADGPRLLGEGQAICLYCHDEPLFRDAAGAIPVLAVLGGRAFDRCDVCHLHQVPTDIGYYLRHIASRLQPARPSLEMAQICAVCHSDPEVLERHKIHDSVASYMRSYHGKAALLGDQKTANCLSCHVAPGANAHLMLGPEAPTSSVNPARLPDTCRSQACHPGADMRLASAGVHLDLPSMRTRIVLLDRLFNALGLNWKESFPIGSTVEFWLAAVFIVLTVLTFGPSMVICVLELFTLVIGSHEHHDEGMERLTLTVLAHPEGRRRLTRFTVSQRIQHWFLAILFTLLALTGFPMKFAQYNWSRVVIETFGGLDVSRLVHHLAGFALASGLFAHTIYIIWTMYMRRREARAAGTRLSLPETITSLPMWIGPQDALKMGLLLAHLMRLRKERPTFGRFSVKEKFEYIGVFWGTIVLGTTGTLLWGEQISSHFISGRVLNIALIAHTYEAFLAVIHVGILHIVNVILSPNVFPLSRATLTGETPLPELVEAHSDQVLEVAGSLGISEGGSIPHA